MTSAMIFAAACVTGIFAALLVCLLWLFVALCLTTDKTERQRVTDSEIAASLKEVQGQIFAFRQWLDSQR